MDLKTRCLLCAECLQMEGRAVSDGLFSRVGGGASSRLQRAISVAPYSSRKRVFRSIIPVNTVFTQSVFKIPLLTRRGTGLAARGALLALRIVQISPAVNLFNRCTPLRITGARHHRIQPPRNMTSKLFPACSAFASPSAIPQPRSPVLREESRRCSMAGRNRRQKLGRYDGFL